MATRNIFTPNQTAWNFINNQSNMVCTLIFDIKLLNLSKLFNLFKLSNLLNITKPTTPKPMSKKRWFFGHGLMLTFF